MGSNEGEITNGTDSLTVAVRLGDSTLTESLDQLLASKTFRRSGQLKRLLVYLRDATISTDPLVWSETSIGAKAFGRRDFNPKLDTIVRVEMRRLRQKLDEYYAGEGAESAVRLRFERSTYRPYVEPYIRPTVELEPLPALLPPAGRVLFGVRWGAGSLAIVILIAGR